MADFLIQRHLPNLPNEHSGGWVDVDVVRDLKAEDAQKALERVLDRIDVGTGRVRLIRWDTVVEYEVAAAVQVGRQVPKGGA